jgi:hypothetical protein
LDETIKQYEQVPQKPGVQKAPPSKERQWEMTAAFSTQRRQAKLDTLIWVKPGGWVNCGTPSPQWKRLLLELLKREDVQRFLWEKMRAGIGCDG